MFVIQSLLDVPGFSVQVNMHYVQRTRQTVRVCHEYGV